jgi:hypothetical protein
LRVTRSPGFAQLTASTRCPSKDLTLAIWRAHPLAKDPAMDLADLLTGWSRGPSLYAVENFTKEGHLEASVTSNTAAARVLAALPEAKATMALTSAALSVKSIFGWSENMLEVLRSCAAPRTASASPSRVSPPRACA